MLKDVIVDASSGDPDLVSGNGSPEIIDTEGSSISVLTTSEMIGDELVRTFSRLVIGSIGLLDEGVYSCMASNDFGEITTLVGELIVESMYNIT